MFFLKKMSHIFLVAILLVCSVLFNPISAEISLKSPLLALNKRGLGSAQGLKDDEQKPSQYVDFVILANNYLNIIQGIDDRTEGYSVDGKKMLFQKLRHQILEKVVLLTKLDPLNGDYNKAAEELKEASEQNSNNFAQNFDSWLEDTLGKSIVLLYEQLGNFPYEKSETTGSTAPENNNGHRNAIPPVSPFDLIESPESGLWSIERKEQTQIPSDPLFLSPPSDESKFRPLSSHLFKPNGNQDQKSHEIHGQTPAYQDYSTSTGAEKNLFQDPPRHSFPDITDERDRLPYSGIHGKPHLNEAYGPMGAHLIKNQKEFSQPQYAPTNGYSQQVPASHYPGSQIQHLYSPQSSGWMPESVRRKRF